MSGRLLTKLKGNFNKRDLLKNIYQNSMMKKLDIFHFLRLYISKMLNMVCEEQG